MEENIFQQRIDLSGLSRAAYDIAPRLEGWSWDSIKWWTCCWQGCYATGISWLKACRAWQNHHRKTDGESLMQIFPACSLRPTWCQWCARHIRIQSQRGILNSNRVQFSAILSWSTRSTVPRQKAQAMSFGNGRTPGNRGWYYPYHTHLLHMVLATQNPIEQVRTGCRKHS